MKTKLVKPAKKPQEPRLDCRQPNYSEGALLMMEQAIGRKFARATAAIKPPPTPATDAD